MQTMQKKIKSALISVFYKEGLQKLVPPVATTSTLQFIVQAALKNLLKTVVANVSPLNRLPVILLFWAEELKPFIQLCLVAFWQEVMLRRI